MAICQFDLYLLPRSDLLRKFGCIPDQIELSRIDDDWWETASWPSDYAQTLSSFIARGASWDEDLELWGTSDGNRIDIWREAGRVVELFVRIDVRRLDSAFLERIVRFSRSVDCLIWSPKARGGLFEPCAERLQTEIRQSRAWEFVHDPAGYLARLDAAVTSDAADGIVE
jgi:hypothetical protein